MHAASGSPTDKGKPGATQGRKATGPPIESRSAGLPKGRSVMGRSCFGATTGCDPIPVSDFVTTPAGWAAALAEDHFPKS